MDVRRIAELLSPFLGMRPLVSPKQASKQNFEDATQFPAKENSCHSEPAHAGEEPAVLAPAQLQHISTYIDILIRWNARVNLTAIRDPEDIVTRHFGESLFAATRLFPRDAHVRTAAIGCPAEQSSPALTVADIGSGAGFPGLPLKLWAPHLSLTLIESNHKKAAFLREVVRALTLTNVDVITVRAETLLDQPLVGHAFNVVTLRAVERFESILPVAASLVAPADRLALLIGAAQEPKAINSVSFQWQESIPVPCSQARILLIGHRLAQG
jgi:16S rRNA (guanine527-N7)-methyltransferase